VTTLEKASKFGTVLSEDGERRSSIDYGKTAAHAVEKVEALGEWVDFHGQRAESLMNELEAIQRRFNNTLYPQGTNFNNPNAPVFVNNCHNGRSYPFEWPGHFLAP